jgi:predicted AlkP superfamily phosphohydrolase/phosphomutase
MSSFNHIIKFIFNSGRFRGRGMMNAKKVICIGLDGAIFDFVQKFVAEGKMPFLKQLIEEGVFSELLPVPPCDTPTNWTSLSTGCWAGTHGITSFHIHINGESLEKFYLSTNSRLCKVEHIWDTAEKVGMKSILLNWPVSWPPTIRNGVVVHGTGPGDPKWRISGSAVYSTEGREGEVKIELQPFRGESPIKGSLTPFTAEIPLIGLSEYTWTEIGWEKLSKVQGIEHHPKHFLLIFGEKFYDKVAIFNTKEFKEPLSILKCGEWSTWIKEQFNVKDASIYKVGMGKVVKEEEDNLINVEGVFRYKLIELGKNLERLVLYRTDIFSTKGWCYPEPIADELYQNVGPFIEGLELPPQIINIRNEWQTYYEQLDYQCDWFARAANYLSHKYEWNLMYVQIHIHDGINHLILNKLYPSSPKYDEKEASIYWERMGMTYTYCDKMIEKIVKTCADENTVIAIVSDHGALPTFKMAWVGVPLIREGLLYFKKGDGGKSQIDWSKTKVYPWRTYLWVNLKGREPHGIVEPGEEFERVREKTINALYNMRDPETGECPIALVLKKEDAVVLGQWGDRVGDLVYYLKPGYTDVDVDRNRVLEMPLEKILSLKDVEETEQVCSHHQYLPTAKLSPFSNAGIFIIKGPSVKKGHIRGHPCWTIDVVPTLAYILGIKPPDSVEGRILWDIIL